MKKLFENWRDFQTKSIINEAIDILTEIAYTPEAAALPKELQIKLMRFLEKNGMPTVHEE